MYLIILTKLSVFYGCFIIISIELWSMMQMNSVDVSFDNVDNYSTLMIVMVYIDIRHITSYPVISICYMPLNPL